MWAVGPTGTVLVGWPVSVAQLCLTLCKPVEGAHQAPLSMGFFRQEYWSGLSLPSPEGLPSPGIEPMSPALQVGSLPSELAPDNFWFASSAL